MGSSVGARPVLESKNLQDVRNAVAKTKALPDVEFQFYPKLNHLFCAGEGILTPHEYIQKHGSVAPYIIQDIAAWILKR